MSYSTRNTWSSFVLQLLLSLGSGALACPYCAKAAGSGPCLGESGLAEDQTDPQPRQRATTSLESLLR
jgi:hypothetical protein